MAPTVVSLPTLFSWFFRELTISLHYRTTAYAFLPDLQAISAKLFELDPQATPVAEAEVKAASVEDEDEALLRELLDDNETNQLNHGSTRTRKPRRPSLYGYQPSTDANAEKHNDSSDDLKIEAEEEEDPEAAVSKKMLAQFVEEKEEIKEKAAAVSARPCRLRHELGVLRRCC